MVSSNTDATKFYVDDSYEKEVEKTIHNWEKLTGLEMEKEVVVKSFMRDVNSYCEIVEVDDNDYEVHYKGGCFNGNHVFKWDKEKHKFNYSFEDGLETNSVTIVAEALLKYLLFEKPIEDTINNCNDVFRFQTISHLGSTYAKCVQESPNGDIELQRNNRIYAGKKPSGKIIKVKPNGRRDSLANCPPNPIVDNANKCTIDDINKEWYIELAKQWANDFKGVKRLEDYKKDELLELANNLGLEVDKKIKKIELIELVKQKQKEVEKMKNETRNKDMDISSMNIGQKINLMKKDIQEIDFVMDCVQATQLGGREYPSIGQYYKVINNLSIKYNLLFKWEVTNVYGIERDMFKPQGRMPQHVTTVDCLATFIDLDSWFVDEYGHGDYSKIVYSVSASGSDTCDKGTSAASSMAFRNWFDKNFAPKYLTVEEFNSENEIGEAEKTSEPKIPTYIPPEKKEELTKEVVKEVQEEPKDSDDVKKVIDNIMKVRELSDNQEWGASTLQRLINGEIDSVSLMEIELKVNNKLETLEGAN